MIQIYFLSIFFNALAGYVLISGDDKEALEIQPGFSLKDETIRLVLGILSMATALLKLLSPVEGQIIILGDLVPVAAGFATGLILLVEYYRTRATLAQEPQEKSSLNTLLILNKKIIGYIAIAAAILHFFFPKILFL